MVLYYIYGLNTVVEVSSNVTMLESDDNIP